MALGGSDRNAKYELSKLLQMGTVAEYQDEFEKLINRVTGISESLLTSFYISGLKLTLSIELLRARPTTLGEAFSLARIIEARLEAIAEKEKEQIIKKKADTILSLRSELASPGIKGSLDADEDIGIDEVSSAIDCVFHIGESNEVRSKFDEFSENKKSVIEVVMGGGEALGVYREKSRGAVEGGRKVLCYVQGSKRLKKKKMDAAIQRRLWSPGIKSAFQDNTLRVRIKCGDCASARKVFDKMYVRNVYPWDGIINGYVKGGMIWDARGLFEWMGMRERDVVTWNMMVVGYECSGMCDEAVKLFKEFTRASKKLKWCPGPWFIKKDLKPSRRQDKDSKDNDDDTDDDYLLDIKEADDYDESKICDNTSDGDEQSEDSEGTVLKEPHEENSDGDADGEMNDETMF
ncbi:retrotransposon gag protein [Tanacetum coccineum]|uniref:Retrotransposon gag protein n=1 Tax=Tanacetum coccineum TaxID=301880 RepID=A0ABQ5GQ34_9ASTR